MNHMTHADIVEIDPPVRTRGTGPRDKWSARLKESRARRGRWMMVTQPMTKATAAQIASDLRRSHLRDHAKMRIRAVKPGDRWETTVARHPENPVDGEFFLWIKWSGSETAW